MTTHAHAFTAETIAADLKAHAAQGRSVNTVRARQVDLEALHAAAGDLADWDAFETAAAAYLTSASREGDLAPATIRRRLSTFRTFAPVAVLEGYRPPTPAPAEPHPIPEGIAGIRRLLEWAGPPERVLVTLCGMAGLRISEARSVRAKDFDTTGERVTLLVRGKGAKQRRIPLSPEAWENLADVVAERSGDELLVEMSDSGARKAIGRLGRDARLSRPIASHDLRATFATSAYRSTKDLRAVQLYLGHASSKTTEVYVGIDQEALGAAALGAVA